jgi:hypothetical protein
MAYNPEISHRVYDLMNNVYSRTEEDTQKILKAIQDFKLDIEYVDKRRRYLREGKEMQPTLLENVYFGMPPQRKGVRARVVRALLKRGARPSEYTLMKAASRCVLSELQPQIEKGGDVNSKWNGVSLLFYCVFEYSVNLKYWNKISDPEFDPEKCVRYLIEKGAGISECLDLIDSNTLEIQELKNTDRMIIYLRSRI